MIHIDTTFAIDLLRERRRKQIGLATQFLSRLNLEETAISPFVQCELLVGAELSGRTAQAKVEIDELCAIFQVAYPDDRFPEVYGEIVARLQRSGQLIGTMDALIATSAVLDDASLVTRNIRHFERIPDLEILSY